MPVSPEKRLDGSVITDDTWSEDAVELAWAPPPYVPERSLPVYAASKIEQERAIWKFYDENKNKRPDMVVNIGKLPVARYAMINSITKGSPPQSKSRKEPRPRPPGTRINLLRTCCLVDRRKNPGLDRRAQYVIGCRRPAQNKYVTNTVIIAYFIRPR